jgi:hypothetical protein
MKKMLLAITGAIIFMTVPFYAQGLKELSINGIAHGKIYFYESYKDSADMNAKVQYFSNAKITLKNKTANMVIDAKDTVKVDLSRVYVVFSDDNIKTMQSCAFVMLVNDTVFASSDSASENSSSKPLSIDLKPSLDLSKSQELDITWNRNLAAISMGGFASNVQLHAEGKFSSKPDSAALNSVQWSIGYRLIWGNAGIFKYFAISGQAGGQHPQDFSQTDLVGSVILSSILPWTDVLARVLTDNQTDASIGLLIQPAIDIVKKTAVGDSSYSRGAIHANWEIPLMDKQYANLYSVAYFQSGYRPRSYIEISIVQKLSTSLAIIAKWVNGELPPLFNRVADFRIGLQLQ